MDRTFQIGTHSTRVRSFTANSISSPIAAPRLWVCDANTRGFVPAGEAAIIELPIGEAGKNWDSVVSIIDSALEIPLGRDGAIIALGGGVVCDVAAFAASVYMRGCALVLMPTTLLAMVDASLGGKTGIDHRDYKNMIGTFYPASQIALYPVLLGSLPETEYRSGLAEVLKHGMLEESSLLADLAAGREKLLERDVELLHELIPRSLAVKGKIVEQDPTEKGIRAHLNLGHSFGHALESVLGLGVLPHGHAVAWGIARAMEAGKTLGETDADYAAEVRELLTGYGYDLEVRIPDLDQYLTALSRDKKRKNGEVRFVLQRRQGNTFTTPLEERLLRAVLLPYSS